MPYSKTSEVAAAVSRAIGRPIRVLLAGQVPDAAVRAACLSGAVSDLTKNGNADLALVGIGKEFAVGGAVGDIAQAICYFDPKAVEPVKVRAACRAVFPAVQMWVLPIEGPDALTVGFAICGPESPAPKISATMPVCDEEADVERVLASFLPVAEEWVVGVDEKSSDRTWDIVRRYAEVPFRFRVEPWSFAAARNHCLERCSQPWIFMTEGHEHFDLGTMKGLLGLRNMPARVGAVSVRRDVGGEQFWFPWIVRNTPLIRYRDTGGVHNYLWMAPYGESVGEEAQVGFVTDAVIGTVHKADDANRKRRYKQRLGQNRAALDGHVESGKEHTERALFYAAQEHASAGDLRKAVRMGLRYLRAERGFCEQHYEGHLKVAEYLIDLKRPRAAIRVAKRALALDPKRVEAECLLGDAYTQIGDLDMARQLYAKAAGVPLPRYCHMFLRKSYYAEGPWRALAGTAMRLGMREEAERAARNTLAFAPGDRLALDILARLGVPPPCPKPSPVPGSFRSTRSGT